MRCALCGKVNRGTIEDVIDAGWEPEYWLDANTSVDRPVCGDCVATRIEWIGCEATLKPSGAGGLEPRATPTDDHPSPRGKRPHNGTIRN